MRAEYEKLEDEDPWFGRVPGCPGAWATGESQESCAALLESVLEGWVELGVSQGHIMERDEEFDALRADIEEGFAAVERGEYTDYNVPEVGMLADKIKAEGMQRALARRALKPTDRQMIDFK